MGAIGRFTISLRLLLALTQMAAVGLGGAVHAVTQLSRTDTTYTRVLEQEAAGMVLVTRAGLHAHNDSRLLQSLFVERDMPARQRILGERDRAQRRFRDAIARAQDVLPKETAALDDIERHFETMFDSGQRIEAALLAGEDERALRMLQEERLPAFESFRRVAQTEVARLHRRMDEISEEATRKAERAWQVTLLTAVLAVLLALFLAAWLLRRTVIAPLDAVAARMRALEAGDDRAPVPGQERADEIGRMARALESFRLAAIERRRLGHEARTDALTGLLNRRALLETLETLAGGATPLLAIAIDLDHFKQANDTHGHATGDALLRAVAQRIRAALRAGDIAGRLGGDEFVVILAGTDEAAEAVAHRLRDTLNGPVEIEGRLLRLGATLGIAALPRDAGTPAGLLEAADQALIRAKRIGRGGVGRAAARAG
ncbi:GGDEF domain-containing protein [Sabulicella glaciei]|uniref:diguanylate cyclase n=1 Tax=Sabulicella glaciei TaxID=2984948 RepID=A0ABT3NX68_9PROT|nr:sensor domain-containing diguanylate cyclase [Roseococcus sp. MDT2-1-1]